MTYEPPRDQWGRPLVRLTPGGPLVACKRPSTVAKAPDDLNTLMKSLNRSVALAIAKHPHLRAAMIAADGDKAASDLVVDEAKILAGVGSAALLGTMSHKFCLGPRDIELPEEFQRDVEAFDKALADAGLELVETEQFRVDAEHRVAGTTDAVLRRGDQHFIGDLKTGKGWESTRFGSTALSIQIASYALGVPYDENGFHPDPYEIDQETGILIQLPAGTGECRLFEVDLFRGRVALDIALSVLDLRSGARDLFPLS